MFLSEFVKTKLYIYEYIFIYSWDFFQEEKEENFLQILETKTNKNYIR